MRGIAKSQGAAMIATGVNAERRREILGVGLGDPEARGSGRSASGA